MKAVLRSPQKLKLSRRALLSGLGVSTALSPFIPLLDAEAQDATDAPPVRLILWFTPHGTVYDNWKPSGGQTDFTLSPIRKPLEPYRAKLNILDGLKIQADGVGAPHTKGPPLLWTASPLNSDMTFTRSDGSGGMYYGWNSAPQPRPGHSRQARGDHALQVTRVRGALRR